MTRPHPAESLRARHALFGGILAADAALPGLPPVTVGGPSVTWTLVTRADRPDAGDTTAPVGRLAIPGGPVLTLARAGDADLLEVSDTGCYLVRDGRIEHTPLPDADPRAVALDLVGQVLPLALERDGAWVLHASAIALPQGALVLVGPRGAGKSTLAAACARAGAPLVADDAVATVVREGRPHALPAGLPLRLRPDAAAALGADDAVPDDGWGKRRVAVPLATAPLPIAAIAFVTPVRDGALARRPLPSPLAIAHLAAAGKLATLRGAAGQTAALDLAIALAAAVPVERRDVPRDVRALGATARALLAAYCADGAGA